MVYCKGNGKVLNSSKLILIGIIISLSLCIILGLLQIDFSIFRIKYLILTCQWDKAKISIEQTINRTKDEELKRELFIYQTSIYKAMYDMGYIMSSNFSEQRNEIDKGMYKKYKQIMEENNKKYNTNILKLQDIALNENPAQINIVISKFSIDTWFEGYKEFTQQQADSFFRKAVSVYFLIDMYDSTELTANKSLLLWSYLKGNYKSLPKRLK